MTHPSGHIERVANQWRVHDHVTGGLWAMHSEEQAERMLKALELRDAAPGRLERAKHAIVSAMEIAEEEDAHATLRRLRKILAELG